MRIQLHDVLSETVAGLLATRHREELIADGQANGMPCSALNTPEEFVADQRERRAPSARHADPPRPRPVRGAGRPAARRRPVPRRRPGRRRRPAPTPTPCSSTSSATAPTSWPAGGRTALSDRPLSDAAGAHVRRLRRRQHRRPHPRRARHGRRQDRVARAARGAAQHLLPRSSRRPRAVGRADDGAVRRPRPQRPQRGHRARRAGRPRGVPPAGGHRRRRRRELPARRARPLRLRLRRPAGDQPAAVDAVDLRATAAPAAGPATPPTPRTSATTSG